jgi:hypothetical protein
MFTNESDPTMRTKYDNLMKLFAESLWANTAGD